MRDEGERVCGEALDDSASASEHAGQAGQAGQNKVGRGARAALVAFVAIVTALFSVYLYWLITVGTLSGAVEAADGWLTGMRSGSGAAVLVAFGPLVALLALVTGLLIHFGKPGVWTSAWPSLQVGALLGACLAAAWFIGSSRIEGLRSVKWLFFVPVVPPLLLAFQGMVMWRQRPRSVGQFRIGVSAELCSALTASEDDKQFAAIHQQLVRTLGGVTTQSKQAGGRATSSTKPGMYTPVAFALQQFALPCLLLFVVGFGAVALAMQADPLAIFENGQAVVKTPEAVRHGIQWGTAGAFTYVLFTFGSRSFRNDLTVGAATWAIVTLITGPALAVVVALLADLKTGSSGWQGQIALFFAGLAPRQVMGVIDAAALKILGGDRDASSSKLIPLTTLRGVGVELAARLREENIEDVTALAYADPIRLVQSMPYDLRQIVEWIDQAQLAVVLPAHYDALRERGVTGAIDLAWRWLQACTESDPLVIAHKKGEIPEGFRLLVPDGAGAKLVYEAARQMFYEEHVRLLWVMYNSFSTTAGDPSGTEPLPQEKKNAPDMTFPSLPAARVAEGASN